MTMMMMMMDDDNHNDDDDNVDGSDNDDDDDDNTYNICAGPQSFPETRIQRVEGSGTTAGQLQNCQISLCVIRDCDCGLAADFSDYQAQWSARKITVTAA
jgi:hypothetical protein